MYVEKFACWNNACRNIKNVEMKHVQKSACWIQACWKTCMFISMYVEKIALWKMCRSNHYFSLETGKKQTKNKILQKYKFPEVIYEGLSCHECKMEPIKDNRYFCLICSDLNFCETCGDNAEHNHPLLLTSSKQNQFK